MSESKSKFVRRNIGEFLQAPPDKDKQGEKPRYYIKITEEKFLNYIKKGSIMELEDPKESFNRMINSDKVSEERKEQLRTQRDKIPSFVIKRLVLKIPKTEFKD